MFNANLILVDIGPTQTPLYVRFDKIIDFQKLAYHK